LKILIFEFATATGVEDPSITAEGRAMLEGLLLDLQGNGVDYLISEDISGINGGSSKPITIAEDLEDWLGREIQNYDACLPIAPEEGYTLYQLTRKIEDNGVKVIGSNSEAVMTCSNKFETYKLLKNNFNTINTAKILFKHLEEYENWKKYKKIFGENGKMVVKPADGVSCSGVQVITSFKELLEASMVIKRLTDLPYFLLQDFVEGTNASVSLLSNGKTALPLSLNSQKVSSNNGKLAYNGGMVPLEHKLAEKAKEIAKRAVESVEGLRGYMGVDMILGDDAYIVEINSRLTTPYTALRQILNFNLGKAIIDSINGVLPPEVVLDGIVTVKKEENHLKMENII
jgi:tyramine---L-glutamate ligase